MELEQILQIIDHVSQSKLTSLQYEADGVKLSLKCKKKTAHISSSEETVTEKEEEEIFFQEEKTEGKVVKSPLVGTFYAASSEDAAPFVTEGERVKKGQVLAIVEAMKLMNEIESEFDGHIAQIYVENGQPVEYGQKLFRIK